MNLGVGEIVGLVVIAVVLFGPDKLPELARKAARVLNYVRNIANNAQQTIQTELGPGFEDFDIRDPKGYIKKKIAEQMDPITADIKTDVEDMKSTFSDTSGELSDIRGELKALDSEVRTLHGGTGSDADLLATIEAASAEQAVAAGGSTATAVLEAPADAVALDEPVESTDSGEEAVAVVARPPAPFDSDAT